MARRGKVRDSGSRKVEELLKRIERMSENVLMVGVFGDAALQASDSGNGLTVGEVAAAHEFSIPQGNPRTWLRGTVDEHSGSLVQGLQKLYAEAFQGRRTPDSALRLTGMALVGKIQQRIANGISPELDDDYLKRKLARYPGATTALIASGQFRGSITSDVVPAGDL